ncbi:Phage tail-collar fibre protein [Sulfitobacter pontiacus]|uniref:Phage tail-collar fibre protein n=1 Tax=Sulfitobacter pontiacus TaxID=60137 RepID=A0A1H2R3K7_9RHOB|nr:phage tail protein [Sulfitobacter pontiacus]SDW13925.1 Phage tail-collar fibre protein [Sulfitobacter pontiacus]
MPTTILTDIAEAKITQAAGSGSQVAITHVALGDGNGASYNGDFDQTYLRRERVRVPIERRHIVSPNAWRVKAEFGAETVAFDVREAGFFDADGDLIALCTFPAAEVRRTGAIVYLIDHVLNFSRVAEGLIIVDAPDDDLFDHVVTNLETQVIFATEQFDQRIAIRALQAAN